MRTFLGLVLLSAFALCSVFGKKCEPLFSQTSPSNWGDVRQGHLEFPIPESTTKWRVDIIFDKPVHTLNPWDGANGKCTTSKNKCTFTNASWNSHKNAGNLKLGFETRFQHSTTPPKFKRIVFRYCTTSPCKKYDEKYIVECGDDSGSVPILVMAMVIMVEQPTLLLPKHQLLTQQLPTQMPLPKNLF